MQLFKTSNFIVKLDSDKVSFDLVLNGLLDFPDAKVNSPEGDRDWGFSLDAGFENLSVGYEKTYGEDKGTPTFNLSLIHI